ncbi:MAG: hypothetical protein KU37_05480 [Sulfuricurvum sp. PC08-66]|nr:MAG: hypothetical protein KU37_05480 [Sulfuricurvum sp. PC08-66]
MKQFEFLPALQRGEIPHAFMLFGESHFLIDAYLSQLIAHFGAGESPHTLYAHEYTLANAKAYLSQGSLFGGANVLVLKSESKFAKKELDELIALTTKSPSAYLIWAYYGDDHRTASTAFSQKGSDSVRLFDPPAHEALAILSQRAKALHLSIEKSVLEYLYKTQEHNVALAYQELEKLSLLNRPLQTHDIDTYVYAMGALTLDETIAQLLEKKSFLHAVARLRETGEEPVRIITAISGYITQLYLFWAYMRVHGKLDVRAILGYFPPPDVVKAKEALAMRFKEAQYRAILDFLIEAELQLKQGKIDKDALFYAKLLQLQRLL